MKIKTLLGFLGVGLLTLSACKGNNAADNSEDNSSGNNSNVVDPIKDPEEGGEGQQGDPNQGQQGDPNQGTDPVVVEEKERTIYLAGDSTVQTYADNQYIGGWGQYLDLFFTDKITVKNAAKGGRSSRSFINEGRLYDTKETGYNYKFTENGGKSIESEIKAGDYLFIQFGHNDDDTKAQSDTSYQYERMVPLGTKDAKGIYPTIEPQNKQSTTANLPADMTDKTKEEIALYGSSYYAYDATGANGTYKGYLKEYIDFAREKGAIPVLITPVARVKFSGNQIIGGPGLHGDGFAYVEAVKQLASEEDVMCIDLFSKSKSMLELATSSYANYVMALKPNSLTGVWPYGYDSAFMNPDLGYQGIEATHYNKFGAYLEAAYIAETIKKFNDTSITDYGTFKQTGANGAEKLDIAVSVNDKPEQYIAAPNLMPKNKILQLEGSVDSKYIDLVDPNRTFPDSSAFLAKMALVPAVDDITIDNADDAETKLKAAIDEFNKINASDRQPSYKESIDAVTAKIAKVRKDAKGTPISSITFDGTKDKLTTTSTPFFTDGNNVTQSNGVVKIGSSHNNVDEKYVGFKISGTGTVYITINCSKSDVIKDVSIDVKNIKDSSAKQTVAVDAQGDYEIVATINGDAEFHIYRQGGTGLMIYSITVELYATN